MTPTSFKRIANSFASDDEPLYDSVASDEDYSSVDNLSVQNMTGEDMHTDNHEHQHQVSTTGVVRPNNGKSS